MRPSEHRKEQTTNETNGWEAGTCETKFETIFVSCVMVIHELEACNEHVLMRLYVSTIDIARDPVLAAGAVGLAEH